MGSRISGRLVALALASAITVFLTTPAWAAEGPPDGSTFEQKSAIADDPPFQRKTLLLEAPTPAPRNNGILYHSHGRRGAFFGTGMAAMEFEMVPHSIGMALCVGDSRGKGSFSAVDWKVVAKSEVGQDPGIVYPSRRYMPGGREVSVAFPGYNVDAAVDAEKPTGEWNTIDLYVYRNSALHVVNGVPVMAVHDITTTDRLPVVRASEGQ